MDSHLFKTKSIEQLITDVERGERALRRGLSAWDLMLLGIGGIIGTGIVMLTGTAAANQAGPAITMSYLAAGLACAFAALCYAEFASMIPIAGSAYTYAYATLGELVAWMIGWKLILEYAAGAMTVAIGWSGYMQQRFAGRTAPASTSISARSLEAPGMSSPRTAEAMQDCPQLAEVLWISIPTVGHRRKYSGLRDLDEWPVAGIVEFENIREHLRGRFARHEARDR